MSEAKSAEYKAVKLTRRNAKASLTRSGRALLHRIENKWSIEEIKVTLINVDKVYNDLVEKHEKFTELVEDDEEFEVEERWLEECQQQFLSFESRAKKYIDETQKSSDLSQSSSKDDVQVATGEKSAENNSEIVEATTQMEALNITETLQVETSQVTESELTQVDASQVTESESTQVETSEAAIIPSIKITLQKCVLLRSRNRECLNLMEMLENTQYSNRILNT